MIERRLWQLVLPLLRLHDARGELEALRRDSDAGPEAGIEKIVQHGKDYLSQWIHHCNHELFLAKRNRVWLFDSARGSRNDLGCH